MNNITPDQREDIKKRLSYIEANNLFDAHYIYDMNRLLSSEQAWKSEVEKQRELNDVLATDNMNAELNLSHMTNLFNRAVEVLNEVDRLLPWQQSEPFIANLIKSFLSSLSQGTEEETK